MNQRNEATTISKFLKQIAIDSNLSVKKCWWNKAEISCNQSFYNLFLDSHLCFSFNQNVITLLKGENGKRKNVAFIKYLHILYH